MHPGRQLEVVEQDPVGEAEQVAGVDDAIAGVDVKLFADLGELAGRVLG